MQVISYNGISRQRWSARWDAHVVDLSKNVSLYLGSFDAREKAARAHDVAFLKINGENLAPDVIESSLNFSASDYAELQGTHIHTYTRIFIVLRPITSPARLNVQVHPKCHSRSYPNDGDAFKWNVYIGRAGGGVPSRARRAAALTRICVHGNAIHVTHSLVRFRDVSRYCGCECGRDYRGIATGERGWQCDESEQVPRRVSQLERVGMGGENWT